MRQELFLFYSRLVIVLVLASGFLLQDCSQRIIVVSPKALNLLPGYNREGLVTSPNIMGLPKLQQNSEGELTEL